MFWPALSIAAKMDRLKSAEDKLLTLAREFGQRHGHEYKITTLDTPIPRHVVPFLENNDANEEDLNIHAVRVDSTTKLRADTQEIPLVLLHGYANAASYFYRNFVGLSRYFDTIYSLDMLGWGLSSRPNFVFKDDFKEDDEVTATEKFFVESLETWRKHNEIPKMILAGHSMGGYMAVAYTEAYPQHVEKLLLISPVGVPEETDVVRARRESMKQNSWRFWALSGFAQNVFSKSTPGSVLRGMPSSWGDNMVLKYVQKRMPMIENEEQQHAIAEYLVANNTLPGSGEHCLNKVLQYGAFAKRPMEYRIPGLKVPKVTFLYGERDWMDPEGGLTVQRKCRDRGSSPEVDVYSVRSAGHLLMLENWAEFNAALILGAGGSMEHLPANTPFPLKLTPANFVEDQPDALRPSSTLKQSTASLSEASTEPQIAT